MTLSPEDEARRQRNLKNAATVIVRSSSYGDEIDAKLQEAYTAGAYQVVLDLAAMQDVPGREVLDSKIKMIPNPNFKVAVNFDDIQDTVVEKLVDTLVGHLKGEQIDRFLELQRTEEEEDERRRLGRMYEAEEREPRFLFQVEGIDETFKSAAKAIAAYNERHGDDRAVKRGMRNAGFKRNPKFINVSSPPEEVVQVIPKSPELPEELREEPSSEPRPAPLFSLEDAVVEAKQLGEKTGKALTACIQALHETRGDVERAVDLLRNSPPDPALESTPYSVKAKKLGEKTGFAITICSVALQKTRGNEQKAIELLRKWSPNETSCRRNTR